MFIHIRTCMYVYMLYLHDTQVSGLDATAVRTCFVALRQLVVQYAMVFEFFSPSKLPVLIFLSYLSDFVFDFA